MPRLSARTFCSATRLRNGGLPGGPVAAPHEFRLSRTEVSYALQDAHRQRPSAFRAAFADRRQLRWAESNAALAVPGVLVLALLREELGSVLDALLSQGQSQPVVARFAVEDRQLAPEVGGRVRVRKGDEGHSVQRRYAASSSRGRSRARSRPHVCVKAGHRSTPPANRSPTWSRRGRTTASRGAPVSRYSGRRSPAASQAARAV